MRLSYLIILILLNFCWSAALSIYKTLALHLEPGGIVTLRFGMAGVCLLLLWPWFRGPTPRGWDLVKTAIMGLVVFMLGHRIQVLGVQLGSAGDSSVLMSAEPLITSVAAAIFLREHIGPRRWVGFLLGMMGVILLNGFSGAGFHLSGLTASLIFISSFVCEAVYSIMGKPLIERASMMKILTLSLLCGTLANLLIDGGTTWRMARVMPGLDWWLIAYMSVICTAVGYGVWLVVIKESDVNVVALTIFAQPLAGLVIAAVWLHEPLHWGQLWGGVAIVAGLVVGLSRQIKLDAPPVQTAPAEGSGRG